MSTEQCCVTCRYYNVRPGDDYGDCRWADTRPMPSAMDCADLGMYPDGGKLCPVWLAKETTTP